MRIPPSSTGLTHPSAFPALASPARARTRFDCLSSIDALRRSAELNALHQRSAATTAAFSLPDWLAAKPTPPGWAQRVILLRTGGHLDAAIALREQTVFGLPTGYLRGGNATGEPLILCEPGHETRLLTLACQLLLQRRRAFLILLDLPAGDPFHPELRPGLQTHTVADTVHWQQHLQPTFDQTLAPFGHRTRRNLRHALRRVDQCDWDFHPALTPDQTAAAAAELSTTSTHPFTAELADLRLGLAHQIPGNFAMGLTAPDGTWLSCLIGRRTASGITEIFWQSNARSRTSDSLCTTMRALLLRNEVERGSHAIHYLGGTCPLMQHCCSPTQSLQTSIRRHGIRTLLAKAALNTRLASAAHPLRRHL